MFPVLFSIGSLTVKTMSLFLFLGFFISSFIFWRKGKEEHYEAIELFDGFLLSSFFGLVSARAAYVLMNIGSLGFDIFKWFDMIRNPGFNLIIGIAVASFYLYRFSIKKKWECLFSLSLSSSCA